MNSLFSILREKIKANPTGLYVLFYTEMWELFGRFSIISLLILYFTKTFHIPDAKAFGIYSAFMALIFATPILGGYLSDRFLGNRFAIIFGASIMAVGNALMVIPKEEIVFLGLAIVAVGSGFFLPSLPPLVSALYQHDETRRDAGFTLYYLGKNLGALLGPILCGIVAVHFGYHYAFLLSALGMLTGIAVFVFGRKHLDPYIAKAKHAKKFLCFTPRTLVYVIAALMIPLVMLIIAKRLDGYFLALAGIAAAVVLISIMIKRSSVERRHIVAILIAIMFVIVFESFLGQGGTTLNLFINREVHREIFGIHLPTSFFYALDPVFMLTVGPFLAGFWMRRAQRNSEPLVTTKFAIALFLLAIGFAVFVFAAKHAEMHGSASLFFVVFAYFIFPIAELCIIPISLSVVTKMSPKGLSALLVGIWMLSNAASSYFTGVVSTFGQVNFNIQTKVGLAKAAVVYEHLFAETAIALALAGVIALFVGPLMKRLMQPDHKA